MDKKYFWRLLTIIMVAMLEFGFVSCKKLDEFSSSVNKSDLVGAWRFTQSIDYTSSGAKEGALNDKSITFDSNNTYFSGTYFSTGYYILNSNELTLRPSSGGKFTMKVAITNAGKKMVIEGSAENGNTFRHTLTKTYSY